MKNIILSISGGGAGGEASAYGLGLLWSEIPELLSQVRAFAGASVGAIEAAYLADGNYPHALHKLLHANNKKAFTPNSWWNRHFRMAPKYDNIALHSVLYSVFGSRTMNTLKYDCYLVAFQITDEDGDERHRRVKVFSKKDYDVRIVDAIMASAAAPLYFGTWAVKGVYYGDGGIVDNLPSCLALSELVRDYARPPEYFRVCSIITGGAEVGSRKKYRSGSYLSLAKNLPGQLLPADIDGEILKVDNFIGEDRHLVVRPPLPSYDLDDVAGQDKLKRNWDNYFQVDGVICTFARDWMDMDE